MARTKVGLICAVAAIVLAGVIAGVAVSGQGGRRNQVPRVGLTIALGRPTDHSIVLNVLSPTPIEAFVEYGTAPGQYAYKTVGASSAAGEPFEVIAETLQPNTRYYYRLEFRQQGKASYEPSVEETFITQRPPGSTFTFDIQGDSHPERSGTMFDAALYQRTIERVRQECPDFYVLLGDDFSIEQLIGNGNITQAGVDQIYARQRAYLASLTDSVPLFLVNGNHEEAGGFLLNGTEDNPAVYAGRARARYFSLPTPDGFYTGDSQPVEHIGLLRDYYAWTWGDALFVVIDPYWHSPVQVDEAPGGRRGAGEEPGRRNRDLWAVTIGDAQYAWLKKTLESSHARYKFVFEHHILGTGRGAVEIADTYEWGGRNRHGEYEFREKRPGWEMPIHQLFVETGVTIYFQGHDHLFAHQQKDGVVYQETPNPADPTYTAFNRDAYRSGDILPNSGHLKIRVSPEDVQVDYIRSYLPQDETPQHRDGEVAFSYTVTPRKLSQ